MTIFVTGGAGFIGSNFVLDWLSKFNEPVVNLDKLTYAGNLKNLESVRDDARHIFVKGDIGDGALVTSLLEKHRPRAILNFAAESHVDRSISGPAAFVQTNIVATFNLLESALSYWQKSGSTEQAAFRFLHVSTDEVYGSLNPEDPAFTEETPYRPNSPYSASKASSDHLVRAFYHTYGLPGLTTNCSNNYGPYQFPEKLIPLLIARAISGGELPIYGDGLNIRDWLYVSDHCEAICAVLETGIIGETYNVGGNTEKTNIDIAHAICDILDHKRPNSNGVSYKNQISFVKDRLGHDRRYGIDSTKIIRDLNWQPRHDFESGISKTIDWYLSHQDWIDEISSTSKET